jgi:hypothetical protein
MITKAVNRQAFVPHRFNPCGHQTTYRGDPKYTTLAENEPVETSCQISQCLFLAGNKLVGTLGTIKDKAEKDSSARDTNKVPPQLATEASDVYTEIRSSKLLEELSRELGECIN